jgi:hypothetical protein
MANQPNGLRPGISHARKKDDTGEAEHQHNSSDRLNLVHSYESPPGSSSEPGYC